MPSRWRGEDVAVTATTSERKDVGAVRVAVSVVLAVLLIAACSDGSGESENAAVAANEAQADGGRWDMLATPQADEVEFFHSLAEMGRIADVVVIAQATGVDGVRRVGPEGDEGIDLAQVRFEVIRAISDWDEDSITLELDVAGPEAVEALEEQVAGFPPALLAVRDKGAGGPEEAGLHRLVNSESLWTEQPDGGLVAPLAEEGGAPAEDERELASELAEIKDLDTLGDHIEAARRDCDGGCGLSQAAWNR